ncbi:Diaminopimelate epimerase [Mycena venus]|uniref:Diaminopimelate epimerase n=1 Tax=Mycena venus TaxID=2733690 RepID=A0A8H6Z1U2_9AGAR|nr:Diaminopimelate epimerase [Mycena venus]
MLPNEVLEKINGNFNQSIVVYVSSSTSNTPPDRCAVFGLRWFGPRNEMYMCGHGTLAAAEAIFCRLDVTENITTLQFETLSGTLTAHRIGDQISLELPAGTTVSASTEEKAVLEGIFACALAKPAVNIRYIGYGGPGFSNYLLVEVNEAEKLSEWWPNVDHFAELAPCMQILVVTSAAQAKGIAYETRMFAPTISVREDHICGATHCLNAPYWAAKVQDIHVDEGYTDGKLQHAKAVSVCSSDIWVSYFAVKNRVQIRGNVKHVAVGMLELTDVVV